MTSSDRETIIGVHLISGLPYDVVKEVMESFAIFSFMNFLEKKETKIPFVGAMNISYKGDEIQRRGKRAVVEIAISPDEFFVRNVGQSVDKEETEFEKLTEKKILDAMQRIEE